MTQEEAVKAVDLMVMSLRNQIDKFPSDFYLYCSIEIANHLSGYSLKYTGKMKFLNSGDEFTWRGVKCKVA